VFSLRCDVTGRKVVVSFDSDFQGGTSCLSDLVRVVYLSFYNRVDSFLAPLSAQFYAYRVNKKRWTRVCLLFTIGRSI